MIRQKLTSLTEQKKDSGMLCHLNVLLIKFEKEKKWHIHTSRVMDLKLLCLQLRATPALQADYIEKATSSNTGGQTLGTY